MPTQVTRRQAEPQVFRLRRGFLAVMIAFGILLLSQGALMAIFLLFIAENVSVGGTVLGLILAGTLLGVGFWGSFYAARRLWKSPGGFAIGPQGLLDPTIHPDPLPWHAIQRPNFRYSGLIGWRFMFDVDVAMEEKLDVPPRRRLAARFWRSLGARSYRLYLFGTEASVERLRIALAPYIEVEAPAKLSRLLGRE